jgi:predicted dehydrogenase
MPPLQLALIGCGIISGQHLEAFAHRAERATVTTLCDTDPARTGAAQTVYTRALGRDAELRHTTDYATVLADPAVDAVDLCLPHHLHAEIAIAAARAGKHILCEKPLALTPEDCDRMMRAAEAAGVILMHGENMRAAETVERGAELIRAGRLGTLVGLQATYAHWQWIELNRDWRTRPAESGGGHLMDGAIHTVDVLRHLGGEIVAVQAMTARFRPELGAQSEDTGVLNFRYAEGHLGQMFACHASRGRGASPMLTAFGTEGCLTLDAFGGGRGLMLFPHGGEPEVLVTKQSWQDTFQREISHFLDVVIDGAPLRSTPGDGRANVQVVLAAYESASTGREIQIEPNG